ncbi:hypothetical protein BC826DRAFT_1104652 [Russula brevipes]|nr:hypothetical protein BC826DRAFT_1104652 [Russula brevipes]
MSSWESSRLWTTSGPSFGASPLQVDDMAGLMSVILNLVGMSASAPLNCQYAQSSVSASCGSALTGHDFKLWISFQLFFCYTSGAAGSLLIVLRIIAIWNRNRFVMMTSLGLLGTNVAFFIQKCGFGDQIRVTWDDAKLSCSNNNTRINTLNLIVTVVTDISLLFLMLVGLLRMRYHAGSKFGLSQFLWKQGLLWLLLATAAEVPPAVFILLNLNAQLNVQIFQQPALIIMAIAGTRLHRSLVDFATKTTDIFSAPESLQKRIRTPSETKRARATPTSISQMVYTDSEQFQTPQMSDQESCITGKADGRESDRIERLR